VNRGAPKNTEAEAEAGDLLGREPGQWLWDHAYGYGVRLREEKATQLPVGRGPANDSAND
jgi:hypothetical protein